MAKVSIIVPVFNVENYLATCLDNLLAQTFDDIEIICVNDGSMDNSLNILQHYKKFDKRISILNKSNGGLSSARNLGLKHAKGDYILFVDSDDYISTTAVEMLYKKAIDNSADVVVYDYIEGDYGYNKCQYQTMPNYKNEYGNKIFNAESLPDDSYKYFAVTAWSKLYKKELIEEFKIKFYKGLCYEDVPFWSEIFINAKKMVYLPVPLYFYNQGRSDTIMKKNDKRCFDVIPIFEKVISIFENSQFWNKYKDTVMLVTMMNLLKKFEIISPEYRKEYFEKIKNLKLDIDFSIYENDTYLDFEKNYVRQFSTLETADYGIFCQIMGVQNNE